MTELQLVATELQREMNALGSELVVDGNPGHKTCREALKYIRELKVERADTIPVPSSVVIDMSESQPPTLKEGSGVIRAVGLMPLCERALAWCLDEAKRYDGNPVPNARVAEYLTGCMRKGENIGRDLATARRQGATIPFCAAFQGFAEHNARLPEELPSDMPRWAAGALEIMRDAQQGLRPGERWLPIAECLGSRLWPNPGAIAVYENVKSTTGQGHVERVIIAGPEGFRSVGGNEHGGRIFVDQKWVDYRNASRADGSQTLALLGFVVRK